MIQILLLVISCHIRAAKFEVISGERPIELNMITNRTKDASMIFTPDKVFTFWKNGRNLAEVKNNSLRWKVPAEISHFSVSGGIHHQSDILDKKVVLSIWRLVELDNFADGDKKGWQGAETHIKGCGPSKDKLLFRSCETKTDYVEKIYKNLGSHTEIKIELSVNFIDQWDNELAYLQIENDIVWTRTHNWCNTIFNHRCILNGVNVCEASFPDLVGQSIKFVYKHSHPDLKVRFGSSLAKDNCKANWAINNIMLYSR